MPGGPVHEGATANLSVLKLAHKQQYDISPDLFQQEVQVHLYYKKWQKENPWNHPRTCLSSITPDRTYKQMP